MADRTREQFSKIYALQCYRRVYEMVVHGYPATEIARYIQESRREYLEVKYESLVSMICRYRDTLVPVESLAPRLPHYVAKKGREFGDRLEELKRLERMYEALEYRFDLTHGDERITGKVNEHLEKQAKPMTDVIMRMHNIKMDLGLSGSRDLGTLTISAERLAEIEAKYGKEAAEAMASPVSRGRILQAVNMAIERARLLEHGEPIDAEFVDSTRESSES